MKNMNDVESEYREYEYPQMQGNLTPRANGYADGLELILRNEGYANETIQYINGLVDAVEWAFSDEELEEADE